MRLEWPAPHRAHLEATMTIPATPQRVWAVLTDYDRLEEFVPSLKASTILGKEGNAILLYQEGGMWLPFYALKVTITFRVTERPPEEILFEGIQGDFLIHRGRWHLTPVPGGTRVAYDVTVEPSFWVPRWVLNHIQRQILKSTFRAVIQRCLAKDVTPGSGPDS